VVALAEAPSVRDVARLVRLSDPRVSPDGNQLALVEGRADLRDDSFKYELYLLDLHSQALRPFTRNREHVSSPSWAPNGSALAFLAPDADKKGQVFVAPMDGGDAQQLTHAKDGVNQFAWRPDGSAIAYAAEDPAAETQGEAKFDKLFRVGHDDYTLTEAPRPTHLWLIDTKGGEARRLTGGSWSLPSSLPPGSPSSPIKWSKDGKSIVFVRQETPSTGDQDKTRIEVVDVASGVIRDLTGAKTFEGYPVISPDGQTVAYWRNRDGQFYTFQDVWLAPFAGGAGRDISGARLDKNVFASLWAADGKSLLVGGNVDATVGLWRLGLDGSATRLPEGDLVPWNGYWMQLDQARDGRIFVVGSTPSHGPELYALPKDGGAPVALTHENDFTGSLTLARSEMVTWTAPNGRALDGVLTHPANYVAGLRAKLVLLVHGGPNSASKLQFNLVTQVLAAKGFMVFEPNYRGSDNLDGAFYASIYKNAGQGPGEDVMAGVKMLQDRGLADPARMAVTGWSYGGYMTVWLAGHYPVWKAAVAGAALTDWRTMYDISDGNVTISGATGMSPYLPGGEAANWAQSPAAMQTKITAPTLILCDTQDFRVPIAQSFSLYRALEDNHVETEFYAIPTGGHFPGDPVQVMAVYDRWIGWVETHLK
jgi:dipeptidyl aminopeptidase/acylaminoacyl peptidase